MRTYSIAIALMMATHFSFAQKCSNEILRKQLNDASTAYGISEKLTLMSLFGDGEQKGFVLLLSKEKPKMILTAGKWLFTIKNCSENKNAVAIKVHNGEKITEIQSKITDPAFFVYTLENSGLVEFEVKNNDNNVDTGMLLLQKVIE